MIELKASVDVSLVMAALAKGVANVAGRRSYRVEYAAPYSVYVHEDLEARHPNGGQAKFLELPARTKAAEMATIVRREVEATGFTRLNVGPEAGLNAGLKRAADFLLLESLALVPVDTGRLRDSGAVREGGAG